MMKILIATLLLLGVCIGGAYAQVIPVHGLPLTFQWDQNTDTDLNVYTIYACKDATFADTSCSIPIVSVDYPLTKATVTSLSSDGVWHFAVTAKDLAMNESALSQKVPQKIDTTAPGIPQNLRIIVTVDITVTQ